MKTKNITLSPEAINAIKGLQHPCGTFSFYTDTLSRLYNYILTQSDEIGMGDNETVQTLRALHFLKSDLASIANRPQTHHVSDTEETADKVETVFEGVSVRNDEENDENEQ